MAGFLIVLDIVIEMILTSCVYPSEIRQLAVVKNPYAARATVHKELILGETAQRRSLRGLSLPWNTFRGDRIGQDGYLDRACKAEDDFDGLSAMAGGFASLMDNDLFQLVFIMDAQIKYSCKYKYAHSRIGKTHDSGTATFSFSAFRQIGG